MPKCAAFEMMPWPRAPEPEPPKLALSAAPIVMAPQSALVPAAPVAGLRVKEMER